MKKVNNNENYKVVEKLIKENSKLKIDKLLKKYETSLNGISVVDEDERLEKYGKNIIDLKNNNSFLKRLQENLIL